MGKLVDLTGRKFGRLTVIKRNGSTAHKKALWECACQCGNHVTVIGSHLLSGNTQSCGCWKTDVSSSVHTSHGGSKTRLYHIWKNMRQRCYNLNKPDYRYYGGRGITVCESWAEYSIFEQWALSHGYSPDLTLDRANVNGNYEPSNCRWVSMKEQTRNMTKTHVLTFNGENRCITEWAEVLGISSKALEKRINRYGWSVERALTTPVRKSGKKVA